MPYIDMSERQDQSESAQTIRAIDETQARVTCGHCNNSAIMEVKASYVEYQFPDGSTLYRLLLCPVCMHVNLSSNPSPDDTCRVSRFAIFLRI